MKNRLDYLVKTILRYTMLGTVPNCWYQYSPFSENIEKNDISYICIILDPSYDEEHYGCFGTVEIVGDDLYFEEDRLGHICINYCIEEYYDHDKLINFLSMIVKELKENLIKNKKINFYQYPMADYIIIDDQLYSLEKIERNDAINDCLNLREQMEKIDKES